VNIFIVPPLSSNPTNQELITQLSRIQHQRGTTVPVIVVDSRNILPTLPTSHSPIDYNQFKLSNFFNSNCIDVNLIIEYMDSIEANWVLIDAGQHDQATCINFILKLSRYNFTSSKLRNCSLVFKAPEVSLGLLARTLNASFNNLPASGDALIQSNQIRTLLMLSYFERALPLPAAVLRRARKLASHVYRRFSRAA